MSIGDPGIVPGRVKTTILKIKFIGQKSCFVGISRENSVFYR